jgi:hypothetical protein
VTNAQYVNSTPHRYAPARGEVPKTCTTLDLVGATLARSTLRALGASYSSKQCHASVKVTGLRYRVPLFSLAEVLNLKCSV